MLGGLLGFRGDRRDLKHAWKPRWKPLAHKAPFVGRASGLPGGLYMEKLMQHVTGRPLARKACLLRATPRDAPRPPTQCCRPNNREGSIGSPGSIARAATLTGGREGHERWPLLAGLVVCSHVEIFLSIYRRDLKHTWKPPCADVRASKGTAKTSCPQGRRTPDTSGSVHAAIVLARRPAQCASAVAQRLDPSISRPSARCCADFALPRLLEVHTTSAPSRRTRTCSPLSGEPLPQIGALRAPRGQGPKAHLVDLTPPSF